MIVLPSFFVALSALDHGGYLQELHINKALPAPVELVQSISTLSVLALTLVLPFAHQGLHVAPLVQMTSLQRLSIREEQYMSINGLEAVLCNLQQLKCLHVPDLSLEDVEALPKSLQLIHIHHSMEVDTIAALLSFAKSNLQTSITFRIFSLERMTYETAHQMHTHCFTAQRWVDTKHFLERVACGMYVKFRAAESGRLVHRPVLVLVFA